MKKGILYSILGMLPWYSFTLNYQVTPLVSNKASIIAPHTDPHLINPWGLFFVPNKNGDFWVADNGTDLSTLYKPDGTPILPLTFKVTLTPTGTRSNPTSSQFVITKGLKSAPASFLFVSEAGTILGFNPSVDSLNAIIAVDNSATGAVYKGFDFGKTCCGGTYIFAADFHNAKVDIFNGNFKRVGILQDTTLPQGYAPFSVRIFDKLVYVTYAKQLPPDNHDDDPGPGHGFVSIFNVSGFLIKHLITQGNLNSPWGIALAPNNFGEFSGALLIGNFGDGKINAYDPNTGSFLAQLKDGTSTPIVIDGLWSLEFDPSGILYFTSGPNGENDGLVGTITPL